MSDLPPQMSGRSISRVSPRALLILLFNDHSEKPLGSGTGFVVDTAIGPCLFTARHCLTGRDHHTGKLGPKAAIPSEVRIYHRVGSPKQLDPLCYIQGEQLYDVDGSPRWFEHPRYGGLCDFACLPLRNTKDCLLLPVNLTPGYLEYVNPKETISEDHFSTKSDNWLKLRVADPVSVIGFPFGAFTNPVLPLWTMGYISSEPDFPTPFGVIYIDCRARKGQSGAPVFARRSGQHWCQTGEEIMYDGTSYTFIGLYSGRINSESDIGQYWSAWVLYETASTLANRSPAEPPEERVIGGPISSIMV